MAPSDPETLLRETEWVTRLARRLLGDGPDADDLAQETLVRAMRGRPRAGEGNAASDAASGRTRAWLTRIAQNAWWERRRADARRVARERDVARPEAAGDPSDPAAVERAHLQRAVMDSVLELDEPERSAVVLRYLEGLPYDEVAARQGVSPATARKRVSRAIATARERLARREGGLASLGPLLVPFGGAGGRAAATVAVEAAPPATTPLLAMALPAKLALAAAALLVLALAVARLARPGAAAVDRGVRVAAESGADPLDDSNGRSEVAARASTERLAIEAEGAGGAAGPLPTHAFVGRVVDSWRRPVEGAVVRFGWTSNGPRETLSDGDGRFRIEFAPNGARAVPSRRALVARADGNRVGVAWAYAGPGVPGEVLEVDAGALVLEDGHPLTVRVAGAYGPAASASVEATLTHQRMPGGRYEADERGLVRFDALPTGLIAVTARAGDRVARATAFVPDTEVVDLVLSEGRSVEVTVLGGQDGTPLEGARLEIEEELRVRAAYSGLADRLMDGEFVTSLPAPALGETSGADGHARIGPLQPGARYSVRATAPGHAPATADVRIRAGEDDAEVTLRLAAARTVLWPIRAGSALAPLDGTDVFVERAWDPRVRGELATTADARIESGFLVVDGFVGKGSLDVRTADGALTRAYIGPEDTMGRPISFHPSSRVEVIVLDESREPLEGVRVELRNQGNNRIGPALETDAEGRAFLEGISGRRYEVYTDPTPGAGVRPRPAGTVDLSEGDARLEVTLSPVVTRRATLAVRVDGVPRLPARFAVRGRRDVRVLAEHPDRGEVEVEMAVAGSDAPAVVWFRAPGFASVEVVVPFAPDAEMPRARVDLERVARLIADVVPPVDGRPRLRVDRLDPEHDAWSPAGFDVPRLTWPNGPNGTFVFDGLGPGTWRVLDEKSSAASAPVAIELGAREARVALDLGRSAWVEGTVRVDDPAELSRTRVVVRAAGGAAWGGVQEGASAPEGIRLREGRFRVRVPGDREVTVAPVHPWLVPAPGDGSAALTGGRTGVVLRLVEGDSIRLPVPNLGSGARSAFTVRSPRLRVGRWQPGADLSGTRPLEWHPAEVVDGTLRAAIPAGRWSLLVEPGVGVAPLALRDVTVDGPTDLPPAEFTTGSTVRIRVLAPAGGDPPRISAFARRQSDPTYVRGINSRGEATVEIPGLGPGRFELEHGPIMDHTTRVIEEIEVDGTNDVEVTLDLR